MIRRISALGASFALHALAALAAFWVAAHLVRVPVSGAEASRPTIVVVHLAEALPSLSKDRVSSKTSDAAPEDLGIVLPDGESKLDLPGFTFDFGKVVKRASSLFPFLTGRLSLEHIVATRSRQKSAGLVNPFARQRHTDERRAVLELREADLQALLDKCWSRRDRWRAFQPIADVARSYHPDAGDLPALLRAYGIQNGLQPYVDTTIRDPRLWTQLGLAADHADFIDFTSRYVSEHGSTKAATELLFLLDKLVQASFDALTALLDTHPSEDLQWTHLVNRDAYAAAVAIRDYYQAHLERLGLSSRDAISAYYAEARLTVLNTILDTTPNGYRANDARFARGAIYWKWGRREEAVGMWREMTIDERDNDVADYSDVLKEMEASGGASLDVRRINRILERQQSRWLSLSYDRLRRFGYHFDTF